MLNKTIIIISIFVVALIAIEYTQSRKGKPSYSDMATSENSYITGRVNLSPICPVETILPNPDCKSRGYATSIDFKKLNGEIVETVNTDSDGYYATTLRVGPYITVPKGGNPYPVCHGENITVTPTQHNLQINLSCDSGIR